MNRPTLPDAAFVVGLALLGAGLGMVYVPAALIAVGGLLVVLVLVGVWRQ